MDLIYMDLIAFLHELVTQSNEHAKSKTSKEMFRVQPEDVVKGLECMEMEHLSRNMPTNENVWICAHTSNISE